MTHRELKRKLTGDTLAVAAVLIVILVGSRLVPAVVDWLPGGPLLWLGVWALAGVAAVVLCLAAALGDRQAALSRRRDSSSLADTPRPHSGTTDRGVASQGLGPAFHLSPGRSGRPSSRRPRR